MKQSKNMRMTAIIYFLLLYVFWAFLECAVVPKLESRALPVSVDVIKEIGCKILFWFLPSLFLILRHRDSMFLPPGRFSENVKKVFTYIPMYIYILLFTAWFLIPAYYQNGRILFSSSFHAEDAMIALSAGITEELLFRGLLLNTALKDRKSRIVFIGNAVMFLLIHFPIWIREGVFMTYMTSSAFLQLMVLSLIFSRTFVKSRSIIVPVILHAYWDLLCFAIA